MSNFENVPSSEHEDQPIPKLTNVEAAEGYIALAGLIADGKVDRSKVEGQRVKEDIQEIYNELVKEGNSDLSERLRQAFLVE